MTAQLVPTGADPYYDETVTLDGTPYILSFSYNQLAACWYLDLETLDGEDVAIGLKLVCNWNLLWKSASPLRPPGQLYVISNSADLSPPGLQDLASSGARCLLVYLPIANVQALAAANLAAVAAAAAGAG